MTSHPLKMHLLPVLALLIAASLSYGQTISVNFHVGNDADNQQDHELASGESAGFVAADNWNNINVGDGGGNSTGAIFAATSLGDSDGNSNVATIESTQSSTWFVGYAASTAALANELDLANTNHDDLFNSYLALNGPGGDGSPADDAELEVSGLGTAFTDNGYDLYIYSDSDRGFQNGDRRSVFTVTPSGESSLVSFTEDDSSASGGSEFTGTYVRSDETESGADYSNYTVFRNLNADSFVLNLTSPDGGRGAISGFQIVARKNTDTAQQPNVILFVVDDMGWADWEKYSDYYETPNMTRLASQGVEFVNGYAAASVCSPTRASLMTGMSPAQHRITKWIPGNSNNDQTNDDEPLSDFSLDTDFHSIADAMLAGGYHTAHIGKWHLGKSGNVSADPHNFGFITNVGGSHLGGPQSYLNYINNSNMPNLDPSIGENFVTDHYAVEAKNYIDARVAAGEKFFMNFDLYAVHAPIQAHPDHIDYYRAKQDGTFGHDNANYATMIQAMDEALGTVLDALEDNGIREETIVIFTSDHGGLTSPSVTSNFPWRGGKGQQWEGGHRVPFIVSGPGIPEGVTTEFQVISHDIYPTVLEMTGVAGDADHNLLVEGKNFADAFSDLSLDRGEPLYWHFPHESNHNGGPYGAVVFENFKFIEVYDTGQLLLFNLDTDIAEQTNIIADHPGLAAAMRQGLHDHIREHDAAVWGGQFELLGPAAQPSIELNLGEPQRSAVESISFTFDGDVSLTEDAISLVQRSTATEETFDPVEFEVSTQTDNGQTTVVIQFQSHTRNSENALVDGNYQVTLDGLLVKNHGFPIGEDLVFGSVEADGFFAYYADADGNRTINVIDVLSFRQTFGTFVGDASYAFFLDFDAGGSINVVDLLQFRIRFGKTLPFTFGSSLKAPPLKASSLKAPSKLRDGTATSAGKLETRN